MGHKLSVAFSPDGKYLNAVGLIVDLNTKEIVKRLNGNWHAPMTYSPDNKYLGWSCIYDINDDYAEKKKCEGNDPSFSPDGKMFVTTMEWAIILNDALTFENSKFTVLDTLETNFKIHDRALFSPDGKTIATYKIIEHQSEWAYTFYLLLYKKGTKKRNKSQCLPDDARVAR